MKDASARKIPRLQVVLLLVLSAAKGSAAEQFPDTAKLYRSARSAEAEYERAARRYAPWGPGPGGGSECDEYVGRFCLYYDSGRDTLPTEPPEIGRYRNRAIDALRAAFQADPSRRATVFPLIRLLLEGKRTPEALEVAEVYQRSSSDVATANMLLGLTRHASADIRGAERAFAEWLSALDSATARRVTDVSYLVNARERRRYRQLSRDVRDVYHDRFWRYADALYLTPGNEIWTEHLSRHAESQLLRTAPVVMASTSWGNDVAELTIRYGTVKGRTQLWPSGFASPGERLLEHWDPEQMVYAAPALDSAMNIHARPGGGWALDTVRMVSGHAPSTIRRMLPLEHQATVFNSKRIRVLRVDAVLPLDSAARKESSGRAVLFALDSALRVVSAAPGMIRVNDDSMFVWSELKLAPAARFYSMEVIEQNTRLAGRARYRIDYPLPNALPLSDILITEPFKAGHLPRGRTDSRLNPRASLLVPRGAPLGVYAEADVMGERPRNLRVRLRILNARRRDVTPATSWIEQITSGETTPIAATVALEKLNAGRYWMELSVTDQDGRSGVSTREFVVVEK